MNVLLVNPDYPRRSRSRNHPNNLPLGLLKISAFHKKKNDNVFLLDLHEPEPVPWAPDLIYVTSLYTYYARYVCEAVSYCRIRWGGSKIIVGGIFASLQPEDCKLITGADEIITGCMCPDDEVDYSLVDVDYQIIHTSRGCNRRCGFCGVYNIEPEFIPKKSIKNEIKFKKLIFYDNNLLANPYIENILRELYVLKKNKKIQYCDSQSGFDGRILLKKPDLATMLKKAGFRNPKIAWDGPYSTHESFEKMIKILVDAGFSRSSIGVFMLYNHELPYMELEKKRIKAYTEGIQVMDCRFRPLDQYYDNYNPYSPQTGYDYYIHPNWTDKEVKQFRKNVRRNNICLRQHMDYHCYAVEKKRLSPEELDYWRDKSYEDVKDVFEDAWTPMELTEVM